MRTYLYHLEFPSGVHFGRHGIGLEETKETLPSDSLASALINAFAVMGEASEVLEALRGPNPCFVLSSLFPYGPEGPGGGRRLYAVPRPLTSPEVKSATDLQKSGKDLKKIRYLEPRDALRWLEAEPFDAEEIEAVMGRARRLARPWDGESLEGWMAVSLRPRVALDRTSQNSAIWWCSVVHFRDGAGLYGLVRVPDDTWRDRLEAAFRLLGDLGLGGERTYGLGSFRFHGLIPLAEAWPEIKTMKKASRYLLLSRYAPAAQELGGLGAALQAWDLEESRGFVVSGRSTTTLKRKRLWFLTEGSVATQPLPGRLVDVTPEHGPALGLPHPVFRSGLGFWFP